MADFSPPVLAAVISGIISSIGAIISILLSHIINIKYKNDMEKQRWLQEVASLSRDIKSKSIEIGGSSELEISKGRIDYEDSSKDIQKLESKLSELEQLLSSAPPKSDLSQVKSEIRTLIDRCENPSGGSDPIETEIDLSEYTYQKSKLIYEISTDMI